MESTKIKPLPKVLKNEINNKMHIKEIENVLGKHQEAFGSGISYFVWYFDDNSCLAISYFGMENDKNKELFWFDDLEPGRFKMNMIKDRINNEHP